MKSDVNDLITYAAIGAGAAYLLGYYKLGCLLLKKH
jgi:hypothetical protein